MRRVLLAGLLTLGVSVAAQEPVIKRSAPTTLTGEIDCSLYSTREINGAIKRAAADGVPEIRLTDPAARHSLAVAVMQPAIEQPRKWEPRHARETLEIYFALTRRAAVDKPMVTAHE